MTVQGYVETVQVKTTAKSGKPLRSPLYSMKIDGQWYGCGFDNPGVSEGETISFDFTEGQYGKELTSGSISKVAAGTAPAATAGGKASSVTPDQRQASIVYQSSRKDAIALLDFATARELVKLPKAGGYDALLAMVDDLTLEFARKAVAPDLSEAAEVPVEVAHDE